MATQTPFDSSFIRLLCCGCKFGFDMPRCLGCKRAGTCLCCQATSMCCKPISNSNACLICVSNTCDLIKPSVCMEEYCQCLCCEFTCMLPCKDTYSAPNENLQSMESQAAGNPNAYLCSGACCCLNACNLDCPNNIGCRDTALCICCEQDMTGCKPRCDGGDVLCMLNRGNCMLVMPQLKIKRVSQCFCIDSRCSLPCDSDVPCIYSCLPFCTFCVSFNMNVTCCKTVGELAGGASAQSVQPVSTMPPK